MSSIAGFFYSHAPNCTKDTIEETLDLMMQKQKRRGPDGIRTWCFERGAIGYGDLACGHIPDGSIHEPLPYCVSFGSKSYSMVYDGDPLGIVELIPDLTLRHPQYPNDFWTHCSQETILMLAYATYGPDFIGKLKGSFALVLWDAQLQKAFLFRDPLGLRPLYYGVYNDTLIFASHPDAILAHPLSSKHITTEGLNEIFSMGPAHSQDKTPYECMKQVKAGSYVCFSNGSANSFAYHHFSPEITTDSYEEIIEKLRDLFHASVARSAMGTTTPACLLSGGLDSSIVCALLCKSKKPKTYSFDFLGSERHFKANTFQPSLDAPYVHQMVASLETEHTTLMCSNQELVDTLSSSVDAHGFPAMGDIDSSLLYFCQKLCTQSPIVVTGECSDELFCGYPWYHKPEMMHATTFPWTMNTTPRKELLRDSVVSQLHMDEYIENEYNTALLELPPEATEHQKLMFLTMRYFMQTLVDRTDCCAAACSMDARVPFASVELAEYLFQIPYELKTKNGEVKHLLREISRGLLPETVRTRKKSPYPKTYDPGYEAMLASQLHHIITQKDSPLLEYVDPSKIYAFFNRTSDYGNPWYGQLMAGPQLMAYYIQINYWLH